MNLLRERDEECGSQLTVLTMDENLELSFMIFSSFCNEDFSSIKLLMIRFNALYEMKRDLHLYSVLSRMT